MSSAASTVTIGTGSSRRETERVPLDWAKTQNNLRASVILAHQVSQLAIAERAAGLIVTFGFIVRAGE